MKTLVRALNIFGLVISMPIGAIVVASWLSEILDGDFTRFNLRLFLVAVAIYTVFCGSQFVLKEIEKERKLNGKQ